MYNNVDILTIYEYLLIYIYMMKSYLHLRLAERKISRTDLMKLAGVDIHTLSGRFPEEATLQKICNALGVRSSEIVEVVPDKPQEAISGGNDEKSTDSKPQKKRGFLGFR